MLCDMHIHSKTSHDGCETVENVAKACIENNISAFAITDHCDIQLCDEIDVFSLVKESVRETEEIKEKYKGKINALVGIEIGEAIWNLDYAKRILQSFNFDVVIGSVHAVRYEGFYDAYSTIDFSTFTDQMLNEYINLYLDELLETLKSIKVDIMAHLTCPLRYINGKYKRCLNSRDFESKITKILEYIIENQIAMEINTSGINSPFGTLMPERWIIEKFKNMGGHRIALGSDAHTKERVGNGFGKTTALLKSLGFDSYCYFENRKIKYCSL